ncbi:MAG: hypothetical protein A2015_01450 [Spirochaetes bacterium GWF1_31_7]|nr:MAG: hypothetical protein A2Y30_08040 [Spirochaetes bacterium GWE1_32_154]OHD47858.1 MAG: hypothetical protein A2015_01450 [Spirochaetes bacterium GWF1_31_7]OHD52219.1 MAG: hypothetical protein A2Y29_17685 [Spirochaetes bacterium GWE2_31_10]OHD78879.1 MAG: hypothetical protein A2355_01270 [Spirochaetes bacterium RIFOXYB1_FULL_32_8]HBD95214.1 hypothetical protein [Spirochaetia bacterium]
MKKIISIVLFVFAVSVIFADTIYFKDGNTMTGEVLKTTDTDVIILSPLGTMTISKQNIDRVVTDVQKNNQVITTSNINLVTKDVYKYDPDYQMSRKTFGLALAFFIPGNILFFGTVAIGTAFVLNYYGVPQYTTEYIYDDSTYTSTSKQVLIPHNPLGGAFYASLMVTGLLVTVISIPFFVQSNNYSKNFKKRTDLSMITGFSGDRMSLGLKLSL